EVRVLSQVVSDPAYTPPLTVEGLLRDPIASWLETTLGTVRTRETGTFMRAAPLIVTGKGGAALRLSDLTGVVTSRCAEVIQGVLVAGTQAEALPETGRPPFAFRLHQFISRGDAVYASLELAHRRYLTTYGQIYQPHSSGDILVPLMFCRECGQEYYTV